MKKIKIEELIKNGSVKNQGSYIDKMTTTDLNTLLGYGDFLISENAMNKPVDESGVLWVRPFGTVSLGGRIVQEYITSSGKRYYRSKYITHPFTAWKEL